jgi:hypothetical protein
MELPHIFGRFFSLSLAEAETPAPRKNTHRRRAISRNSFQVGHGLQAPPHTVPALEVGYPGEYRLNVEI